MPQDDNELLSEGIRSYRKVLFAVVEFRKELQKRIRNVLDGRLGELATAMNLDAASIKKGLGPYAEPANISGNIDGSCVYLGWKYERQEQCKLWFYWYADEETTCGAAYVDLWLATGPRERAVRKLQTLGELLDYKVNRQQIYVSVSLEGTDKNAIDLAINAAFDKAVALWTAAGGVSQFLSEI